MATKKTTAVKQEDNLQINIESANPLTDMVEVELFEDGNQYKHPVYVSVNGRDLLIPRGRKANIPVAHYEVLVASRRQEIAVANLLRDLQAKTDARMEGAGQTLAGIKPEVPEGEIRL